MEYRLESPEECSDPTETFLNEVTTDTQITISNLTPFTTYTIHISARLGMVTKTSTTATTSITTQSTGMFSQRFYPVAEFKSLVIDTKSNTKSITNRFQFIVTTWVCIPVKCLLSCLFINTEYLDARFFTNYINPPGCY